MNRRGKTKEGFLYVKQPSRFGKAWKRKWVVVRTNTTKGSDQSSVLLELYLEKGAYNKQVTSLLLEGITQIKRVASKSQPRAFEFSKGSVVSLTLAGESEMDTQEWIEVFRKLLLPMSENKELTSIQGYGTDVIRVSVIPNKDSERLKLSGSYLAGVSRLQVALHHVVTGEKCLEWDLRHMKRFMLPSKGPQQDLEKIACLQISNRSPQGEGEYLLYSPSAKTLVETIYERLSSAITVKERRSRTSSMLFEIPPKELEQLAKAIQEGGDPDFVMVSADGSIEDNAFQEEEENKDNEVTTNGDSSVKANGDAKENHVVDAAAAEGNVENRQNEEIKANGDEKQANGDEIQANGGEVAKQEASSNENHVVDATKEEKEKEEKEKEEEEEEKEKAEIAANGDPEVTRSEAGEKSEDNTVDTSAEETKGESSVAESSETTASVAVAGVVEEDKSTEDNVEAANGTDENGNDNAENEQTAESVPVPNATDGVSTTITETKETQDFAADPIDADEEVEEPEVDLEVKPRMPPCAEEKESESVECHDASEQIDDRTAEAIENAELQEGNAEQIEVKADVIAPEEKLSFAEEAPAENGQDTRESASFGNVAEQETCANNVQEYSNEDESDIKQQSETVVEASPGPAGDSCQDTRECAGDGKVAELETCADNVSELANEDESNTQQQSEIVVETSPASAGDPGQDIQESARDGNVVEQEICADNVSKQSNEDESNARQQSEILVETSPASASDSSQDIQESASDGKVVEQEICANNVSEQSNEDESNTQQQSETVAETSPGPASDSEIKDVTESSQEPSRPDDDDADGETKETAEPSPAVEEIQAVTVVPSDPTEHVEVAFENLKVEEEQVLEQKIETHDSTEGVGAALGTLEQSESNPSSNIDQATTKDEGESDVQKENGEAVKTADEDDDENDTAL